MAGEQLIESLTALLDHQASQQLTVLPARVTAFDRTERTATVQPVVTDSGQAKPPAIRVPVVFPGVFWDVQDGETGLLLCADENWRTWWRTGEDSDPEDTARHDLSNAFFLAGVSVLPGVGAIPGNRTVVPIPVAGGKVLIGSDSASEALVLGTTFALTLRSALLPPGIAGPGFLVTLWNFVTAAAGVPALAATVGPLLNAIQQFNDGLQTPGGSMISDVVRTD